MIKNLNKIKPIYKSYSIQFVLINLVIGLIFAIILSALYMQDVA